MGVATVFYFCCSTYGPQPFLTAMTIHRYRVLLSWDDQARQFVALIPDLGYAAIYAASRTAVLDAVRDLLAQRLRVARHLGLPLQRPPSRIPQGTSRIREVAWVEIAQP